MDAMKRDEAGEYERWRGLTAPPAVKDEDDARDEQLEKDDNE